MLQIKSVKQQILQILPILRLLNHDKTPDPIGGIMKAIGIEVDDHEIEASHRKGNKKGTQRKQLSVFATVNLVKGPFITRRN